VAEAESPTRGLPRGRTRLPRAEVRARQRERLVAAALSAVAELGYAPTTVGEIARRARVSPNAFYDQFDGKQDCVLRAIGEAMLQMRPEAALEQDGLGGEDQLRAIVGRPLEFFASRPELARAAHLELRAAGPDGRALYFIALDHYAGVLAEWHRNIAAKAAAQTPERVYAVAAGGIEQLITERVHADSIAELPELTDLATELTRRTLGVVA
jgi:AcrR family transcriptional regulator